jgi:hypothetical protein
MFLEFVIFLHLYMCLSLLHVLLLISALALVVVVVHDIGNREMNVVMPSALCMDKKRCEGVVRHFSMLPEPLAWELVRGRNA